MYTVGSSLATDEPIMLINRAIGFDPEDGQGIDGAAFQQELFDLDNQGFKTIKVYINSPGGVVMDGYNIYNAILKTKTPVDTYNVGIAASIAGVIFMAGRRRIMADYASLMMHNPFGGTDKKQLDAMKGSLCTMLAARSGIKSEDVAYMMDRTTWMNPAECMEKGFCTDIEVTNDHNKKYMPASSARAMWKAANNILPELFSSSNTIKNSIMENTSAKATGLGLIANYLDLNVDATENSVLSAVKNRINGLILAKEKADEELDKMKKSLDKAKADYDEIKEKYDQACKDKKQVEEKAKKDAKEAEDKVKEEKDKAKKVEAKAMVDSFVKIGKIKNEDKAIEKWVALAVTDLDGTKAILDEIPLNKQATTLTPAANNSGGAAAAAAGGAIDPNVTGMSAMQLQARIRANAIKNKQTA